MAVDTVITTHEVTNQPPPLVDYDLFSNNVPLVEALRAHMPEERASGESERVSEGHGSGEGRRWAEQRCSEVGRIWGSAEVQEWGRLANENPPRLRTHDRYGNRIDEVEFHPAYHQLMALSSEHELHSLPWTTDREGGQVVRAALTMSAQASRRPASARRAKVSTPLARSGAAATASTSRWAARRKTSAKSSAFELKWRYTLPVATPARSATAATDAAPNPPPATSSCAARTIRSRVAVRRASVRSVARYGISDEEVNHGSPLQASAPCECAWPGRP